jgi:signal transduction histidine kinase
MKKKQNFQNQIARRIIIYAGFCCVVICLLLLAVFALKLHQAMNQQIDFAFFEKTLTEILLVICIGCTVTFIALYFIARSVANKSIEPLKQALNREKSFTSYASHEFRTPLAVLKGSMEVLIRKPRTVEEYEKKIKENIQVVDGMNTMVNNLLTLTRLESDKVKLNNTDCSVKEILTEAYSNYVDAIIKNKLHISLTVSPDDLIVNVDKNSMLIILNNILSNATKYCNPKGYISLRAYRKEKHVIIEIENTGKGISKEETALVFNQFYRSIANGQQKIQGYGLGLAIVKRFTEIIGANVEIESDIEGTTILRIILSQK